MGDGLKITKDKRHRSSSSLAGGNVEGTRSERKLHIRASIPEVDDQFAIAEARCDDLQEKIDMVKGLKRRRKLKKRSMTRVSEQTVTAEHIPFISVRTQPKKKVLRRPEVPAYPMRGYLDPATLEQHEMVGQVRGYNQMYRLPQVNKVGAVSKSPKACSVSRGHPEGDVYDVDSSTSKAGLQEVACGDDDGMADDSDNNDDQQYYKNNYLGSVTVKKKKSDSKKMLGLRRRIKDVPNKEMTPNQNWTYGISPEYSQDSNRFPPQNRRQTSMKQNTGTGVNQEEERPVVELYNKSRGSTSPESWHRQQSQKSPDYVQKNGRGDSIPLKQPDDVRPERTLVKRKSGFKNRHYQNATVSSQMKQAPSRCEQRCPTRIPFVGSKSPTPSHNIGVNIQQILNGMKIQQPVSGIPLSIAHHMGLSHVSSDAPRSGFMVPSLDSHEMNAIRVGQRLVRLSSHKKRVMPYKRLLHIYSEGDGIVSRFLRKTRRSEYTSMYNLTRDDTTSNGHSDCQENKESLAVYAELYREYELICATLKQKPDQALERRKEALVKELTARADHVGKVVDEQEKLVDPLLQSSASHNEDYRHSAFKDFHVIPEDDRQ